MREVIDKLILIVIIIIIFPVMVIWEVIKKM